MKVKVHLGIGYVGANHDDVLEIDDDDLEGLSEQEVEDLIDEYAQEWAFNHIDISWKRVDEE